MSTDKTDWNDPGVEHGYVPVRTPGYDLEIQGAKFTSHKDPQQAASLLQRLLSPREWRSLGVTAGTFVQDGAPYQAADRIVALEAENATLKQDRDKLQKNYDLISRTGADLAAECDRLRQALQDIAKQHNTYEQDENEQEADNLDEAYDMIIARARLALSPSETEEGG